MDKTTTQEKNRQYPGYTPEVKQELEAWARFLYEVYKRKKRDIILNLRE